MTIPFASGQDADLVTIEETVVEASADASEEGLPEALPGGQVASGSRNGFLGALDNMETPFTTTSYTAQLIDDQQAQTVGDVLLNDPAVRLARGFGNFQQTYIIRGLPTYSDDLTFNGLYGLLPRQYLSTEPIERVEVFRGATAFLNGAAPSGSSLGGTVNILPKRAGYDPLTNVTVGVQNGGQLYGALDVSRRALDDRFGIRFNAGLRDGETAVDGEDVQIGIWALGLDWREDRFRASMDLGYQEVNRDASQPNITIASGLDIPDAPDASRTIAQPWTYADDENLFGTARLEYDVTNELTLFSSFGFREGEEENRFANPTVRAADGSSTAYRFDNTREDSVLSGEVGLRGDFYFQGMRHRPSVVYNAYSHEEKNAYAFSDFGGFANNIYDPYEVTPPVPDAFVGGVLGDPLRTLKTEVSSVAFADMVSLFDEKLILLGGLRYQRVKQNNYDVNTGDQIDSYDESAWTPSVGALYKLTPELAIYGSYIEGLQRGDIAPTTSGTNTVQNGGEALEPYTTQQYEVGLKYESDNYGGSLALFQSEKPVVGLDDDFVYKELYDQRYRGVELNVYGEPLDGFRILGGVSFLDTERNGLEQIGSPDYQFNFNAEYDLPFAPGLTLDGRVIHTASQFADEANTQEVESWTRFDLGARYQTTLNDQLVTFRARLENVAGEDYYASVGGFPGRGYLTLGQPRTLSLSASWEF
ncbi:MAG: TonB-dependent receptor [Verrucomicrobiota bacterium JB023]|nr:TonB-dependent receptor [Verrucomicrobiota bacterium JB023]